MTHEAFSTEVARLQRRRVTCALVRSFTWYRQLNEEQRYTVDERIALCVGAGPCSPEAWTLARFQLQQPTTKTT